MNRTADGLCSPDGRAADCREPNWLRTLENFDAVLACNGTIHIQDKIGKVLRTTREGVARCWIDFARQWAGRKGFVTDFSKGYCLRSRPRYRADKQPKGTLVLRKVC